MRRQVNPNIGRTSWDTRGGRFTPTAERGCAGRAKFTPGVHHAAAQMYGRDAIFIPRKHVFQYVGTGSRPGLDLPEITAGGDGTPSRLAGRTPCSTYVHGRLRGRQLNTAHTRHLLVLLFCTNLAQSHIEGTTLCYKLLTKPLISTTIGWCSLLLRVTGWTNTDWNISQLTRAAWSLFRKCHV